MADATLKEEILAGLRAPAKHLPARLLYDAVGSKLFEAITLLDVYEPTRLELALLADHAEEIAATLGEGIAVVELGPGDGRKVCALLAALHRPRAYVPVDVSATALEAATAAVAAAFPDVDVVPVVGDFTKPLPLPDLKAAARWVVFYPGSTLGNLDPEAARAFLGAVAGRLRGGDVLLLGLDLVKPDADLALAYDDPAGVTAAFNKNILLHINARLGGTLDPRRFDHVAVVKHDPPRVEMHLRAREAHTAEVGGEPVRFEAGSSIHTESSHKFRVPDLRALAEAAGFEVAAVWTDASERFAIGALRR